LDSVQDVRVKKAMKVMTTHKEDKTMADMKAKPETVRGMPSLSMIGLLVVQLIIGYEWLLSGIAKFKQGDFPSGLGDDLRAALAGVAGWYAGFINSIVIPNAPAFGYLIETAEVLAGLVLIIGPLILIFAWGRASYNLRVAVIALMIAASIGGIFMALNFHIANGANHPWVLPDSGFDEGVDIDLLLVAIQSVISVAQFIVLNRLRQKRA
jgi:thiosulfate dehydrogenase (quinone) large subunit